MCDQKVLLVGHCVHRAVTTDRERTLHQSQRREFFKFNYYKNCWYWPSEKCLISALTIGRADNWAKPETTKRSTERGWHSFIVSKNRNRLVMGSYQLWHINIWQSAQNHFFGCSCYNSCYQDNILTWWRIHPHTHTHILMRWKYYQPWLVKKTKTLMWCVQFDTSGTGTVVEVHWKIGDVISC